MLNHAPATQCPELDDAATNAVPADDVREDAPTLEEVQKAIRKLRNGWAAGPNEITPELLKTAEIPISTALHQLFLLIWKSGKVPADWKEAVIISLYKGKAQEPSAAVTGQSHCCQCRARFSPMCFWNVCSPFWPVSKDLSNLASHAVARLLTPYWHYVSWLSCIVNFDSHCTQLT